MLRACVLYLLCDALCVHVACVLLPSIFTVVHHCFLLVSCFAVCFFIFCCCGDSLMCMRVVCVLRCVMFAFVLSTATARVACVVCCRRVSLLIIVFSRGMCRTLCVCFVFGMGCSFSLLCVAFARKVCCVT